MAADERPAVATEGSIELIRELLRAKGNELDIEAQRLRAERIDIDGKLEELNRRQDAIDVAFKLPDDVLERMVVEVGNALHPEARDVR